MPNISFAFKALKVSICTLFLLAAFDAGGLFISFLFDLRFDDFFNVLLCYAFWLVLGSFCGITNYFAAGAFVSAKSERNWTDLEDSRPTGILICTVAISILVLLLIWLFAILRIGEDSSHYVPASIPLTITFFAGSAASTILGHNSLHGRATRPQSILRKSRR